MGNAIKFTHTGGVHLSASVVEGRLRIDVSDTGVGIAEQDLERVFASFEQADVSTTRKYGGTGLGLSISRRLAGLLGGALTAASTPGAGSTFTLTVPIGEAPPLTDSQRAAHGPASRDLRGRRVLLVEDGPDNQRLLTYLLSREGVDVVVADNGQEAVNRVLGASGDASFDLVLMDMQLPVMDGYTATARLREHGVTVPVVALTANAMVEDRTRCLDAGCDDFVAKPVRRATLLEVVSVWAGRAGPPLTVADPV